jgi:hypothetical protein
MIRDGQPPQQERWSRYAVNTPEEFAQFIARDRKSAERIFKESGQQPQ